MNFFKRAPGASQDMVVKRVVEEFGTHIEPPLDQRWSNLEKLWWQAAVVKEDTGVEWTVGGARGSGYSMHYKTRDGYCSMYAPDYHTAWYMMGHFSEGYQRAIENMREVEE